MGQGAGSETHKRRARQHEIQRMQGRAADVVVRRDTYDTAASLAIAALGGPKLCTYVHTYVRNVHTQLHMYGICDNITLSFRFVSVSFKRIGRIV